MKSRKMSIESFMDLRLIIMGMLTGMGILSYWRDAARNVRERFSDVGKRN